MRKPSSDQDLPTNLVAAFPAAGVKDGASSATPGALNELAAVAARQFQTSFLTARLLGGIWRGGEFAILVTIGLGLYAGIVGMHYSLALHYGLLTLLGASALVLILGFLDGYQVAMLRSTGRQLIRLAAAWGGVLALMTLCIFFLKQQDTFSRIWLASWFVSGFVALAAARIVLAFRIRRWARNGVMERRAVIVGGGTNAETLIRSLESQPESDIRICGIFDDRNDRRSPPIVAGYPKLGTIKELVEFARVAKIDMLIVTLPLSAERRLLELLKDLWVLPLDIRLSAHSSHMRFRPRSYSFIGSVPFLDVLDKPLADWDWVAKRVLDMTIASLALVILSPLMLATALAVKLDSPGPVFFRQKRHGFNNQIIDVFKFRSLHHAMSDPLARSIVTKGDRRVTRVGRFIRKTSIDELPQLFNVLRGELSLVGPRPHAVHAMSSGNEAFVEIVEGYFGRHKVKPGITGYAQIKGWRGEIDEPAKLKQRFDHDLFYIENWSILFDLYILAMTPISLLRSQNAY